MVGTTEFNIPLADKIDVAAEIERLEKERTYLQGFLASVMKKLSNERFVNNAPAAVVEAENKKKADAESKLANINQTLEALKH
jgi:valyl-tRNA synthetase